MPGSAMLSIRMPDEVREQLEATAEAHGETRSALMQRYIEEGLRMDRHAGIVFRSGPAGRRPGLAAGPDVWEVMTRIAVEYYADYPAEIDAWLARVDFQAEEAERTFRRRQDVLR